MANAKKDAPAAAPVKVAVILRSTTRPGIRACGDYLPDRPYQVEPAEAQRLVAAKGFEFVTPGDAAACKAALDAAQKAAEAAATKEG